MACDFGYLMSGITTEACIAWVEAGKVVERYFGRMGAMSRGEDLKSCIYIPPEFYTAYLDATLRELIAANERYVDMKGFDEPGVGDMTCNEHESACLNAKWQYIWSNMMASAIEARLKQWLDNVEMVLPSELIRMVED